jgi:addiction module RelB/DinJ family antitoxin
MNNTTINIKTDAETKAAAQALAAEFGVSLSSLITMTLRNVIRTKRLDISLIPEAPATPDEVVAIKQGIAEHKAGRVTPLESL